MNCEASKLPRIGDKTVRQLAAAEVADFGRQTFERDLGLREQDSRLVRRGQR